MFIETIVSHAIAFSLPINPSFSTVLPFKLIKSLSSLLNLDNNLINLKGKTVEKLGLIGHEKAIACETIISLTKYD